MLHPKLINCFVRFSRQLYNLLEIILQISPLESVPC
jgi:hypothetical protein